MNMVTGLPSGCDFLVNNLQDNSVTKMRNIVFCVLITFNLYVMLNMYAYWKSIFLYISHLHSSFLVVRETLLTEEFKNDTEKIHHFKVKSKLFHDCQAVSQCAGLVFGLKTKPQKSAYPLKQFHVACI